MEYSDFINKLNSGGLPPVCAIFGDDGFLAGSALSAALKKLLPGGEQNPGYVLLEDASIQAISDAVFGVPFGAENVTVEVRDFSAFGKAGSSEGDSAPAGLPDSELAALTGLLSDVPPGVTVLFTFHRSVWKPDKRKSTVKDLLKCVAEFEFSEPTPREKVRFIKKRLRTAGKDISDSDCEYIVDITDGQLSTLAKLTDILATADTDSAGFRAAADALCIKNEEALLYELTDALAKRDAAAATSKLRVLLAAGEASQIIASGITGALRRLLLAKYLAAEKRSGEFSRIAGIKSDWQAKKIIAGASAFSERELEDAVKNACRAARRVNSQDMGALYDLTLSVCGSGSRRGK
jgi:DNA polymerase-3 subunit delta